MKKTEKPDFKQAAFATVILTLVAAFSYYLGANSSRSREIATYGTMNSPVAVVRPSDNVAPSAVVFPATGMDDLSRLGDRHFEAGRFSDAIPVYRQALQKNPQDAETLKDLGLALFYTGKTDEGLIAVRLATGIDPKLQASWLSLGYILTSTGRLDEANEALKKTIALDARSAQGIEAKRLLAGNLSPPPPVKPAWK